MNEAILETEKLVHSLSDELLKLKSAVEQYEESRKSLDAICESLERIGNASAGLVENTKQFLTELDKIGFEPRLQQLQDDSARIIEGHTQQLDALNNIQKNLNQHSVAMEQRQKDQLNKISEHDERMRQASREQSNKMKVAQGLILVLLALQAVTLAAIFMR